MNFHSQAMRQPMVIGANAVAGMLGMNADTFRKKRAELEAHGFPGKLPGLDKYSEPAVRRWIETNGQTSQPAAEDAISAITVELEAEYGRGNAR